MRGPRARCRLRGCSRRFESGPRCRFLLDPRRRHLRNRRVCCGPRVPARPFPLRARRCLAENGLRLVRGSRLGPDVGTRHLGFMSLVCGLGFLSRVFGAQGQRSHFRRLGGCDTFLHSGGFPQGRRGAADDQHHPRQDGDEDQPGAPCQIVATAPLRRCPARCENGGDAHRDLLLPRVGPRVFLELCQHTTPDVRRGVGPVQFAKPAQGGTELPVFVGAPLAVTQVSRHSVLIAERQVAVLILGEHATYGWAVHVRIPVECPSGMVRIQIGRSR